MNKGIVGISSAVVVDVFAIVTCRIDRIAVPHGGRGNVAFVDECGVHVESIGRFGSCEPIACGYFANTEFDVVGKKRAS